MKFLDTFSGIGGFRIGMEAAGHECIGYVEIDKFARKSYEAIHDTKGEWTAHDITRVTDESIQGIGRVDVITGGFPCQAFSVAGKRGGFSDTRGTLFFEIARFASILRPRYLFLENVTGLLNHENGNTFETILGALDEIGYDAEWDVLNSKDYGVPQNRERVFIIGHLRGPSTRKVFPVGRESENACVEVGVIEGISGHDILKRCYSFDGISPTLNTCSGGDQFAKFLVEASPVLTPDRAEKKQNGRRFKDPGEPMFTLTSQDRHGVMIDCINPRKEDGSQTYQQDRIYETDGHMVALSSQLAGRFNIVEPNNYKIRRLTPRECFRLQGFPDSAFNKAAEVNSDSQLYKQAGNSVSVPVIYEIAKRL